MITAILTLYFLGILVLNLFQGEPEVLGETDEEIEYELERQARQDIFFPIIAIGIVNAVGVILYII